MFYDDIDKKTKVHTCENLEKITVLELVIWHFLGKIQPFFLRFFFWLFQNSNLLDISPNLKLQVQITIYVFNI